MLAEAQVATANRLKRLNPHDHAGTRIIESNASLEWIAEEKTVNALVRTHEDLSVRGSSMADRPGQQRPVYLLDSSISRLLARATHGV